MKSAADILLKNVPLIVGSGQTTEQGFRLAFSFSALFNFLLFDSDQGQEFPARKNWARPTKMNHETQVQLIDELLGLRKAKSAYLDAEVNTSPVEKYLDPQVFDREKQKLFLDQPILLGHSSELPEAGSFFRKQFFEVPLLVTRDRQGDLRAFFNVCRHRGARLVEAENGCKHRFSCPYHAWTWDNQGKLIGVPHREQGFPEIDMENYGLKSVACEERNGWIWICLNNEASISDQLDASLSSLSEDLDWLAADQMTIFEETEKVWNCNWKVVVEGGLESYHFRVAHAATIGSLFHDNPSTYQTFGQHIRSILARTTVDDLVEKPTHEWKIREHANVLHTIFPNCTWLVQADHIVLIQFIPEAVDKTRIRCSTLIPKTEEPLSEKAESYWRKNHRLTIKTLNEDFELAERIQEGLALGVNDHLTFGRFEGALAQFNQQVDEALREI